MSTLPQSNSKEIVIPLNLSKALFTFSASVLLVAASATSSDARQHAKRLNTPQSEAVYDRSIPIRRATAIVPALPASRLCTPAARTAAKSPYLNRAFIVFKARF